jgi:hypothetical protein
MPRRTLLAVLPLLALLPLLLPLAPPAAADTPLPPPQVHSVKSADGRFEAESDPATFATTVYALGPGGARTKQWAMVGWFRSLALASDGEHLVIGYDGLNLLPVQKPLETIVLRFVRRGELLEMVTAGQVVGSEKNLRRTASHFLWLEGAGFEEGGRYVVVTLDVKRHAFDPATGKEVAPAGP